MTTHTREAVERGELAVVDGRRHLNLTHDEREALAQRELMERAIALFLDLQQDHTWQEIADSLGLSLSKLKRMTQTGEFQRLYDEALATVGHDPRLQAVKSSLGDLLPAARRRLGTIITSGDDRTAMRAIEKLFTWTGVEDGVQNEDPAAFANFLQRHGAVLQADVNILNVNIPPQYQDAFSRFLSPQRMDTDVVEGDVESSSAPSAEDPATPAPDHSSQ
jgi:hypothetical protein